MTSEREVIGKGQYAVEGHQQFVNREGNLVRTVKGEPESVPIGEAYAFLDVQHLKMI